MFRSAQHDKQHTFAVILSKAKNGATGTSDMDCQAAQGLAVSESGDERVQSLINSGPICL